MSNYSMYPLAQAAKALQTFENRTYIECGGGAGRNDCYLSVGHTRANCEKVKGAPFPSICACNAYFGFALPQGNCTEAHCVYGADACKITTSFHSVRYAIEVINAVCLISVFSFGLFVLFKLHGAKKTGANVLTTSLLLGIFAALLNFAWHLSNLISIASGDLDSPRRDYREPFGIPAFSAIHLTTFIVFPLMYAVATLLSPSRPDIVPSRSSCAHLIRNDVHVM